MQRNNFLIFMVLFLVASMAWAGGQKSDSSGTGERPVTVTIWHWDEGFINATVPVFEKSHPNIKFEVVAPDYDEYPVKVQQSVIAGLDVADVLWAEMSMRAELFELDIWEDLSKEPYNVKTEVFFDSAIPLMQNSKGMLVGIDQSLSPAGLAYKKGLAKQYFGTDDRVALERIFSSLDDFVTKGAEVAKASNGRVYMLSGAWGLMDWLRPSGRVVDNDGAINLTRTLSRGLEFIIKLKDVGAIDALIADTPQEIASYAQDNHIFYPMANWTPQYIIKPADPNGQGRWGVMIPPGGAFSWGGTTQGIYKGSKCKAEAWEFIKWCSFTQEGVNALKSINSFTPVKAFYDDPNFTSNFDPYFGIDMGVYFYKELMPMVTPRSINIYDNYIDAAAGTAVNYIMSNRGVTLQQALDKAIEELRSRVNAQVR